MVHNLKIEPLYFEAVASRLKNFEIRKNDRNFKVGDFLHLQEFNPKTQSYTGRTVDREILYILDKCAYLEEGYISMSIN